MQRDRQNNYGESIIVVFVVYFGLHFGPYVEKMDKLISIHFEQEQNNPSVQIFISIAYYHFPYNLFPSSPYLLMLYIFCLISCFKILSYLLFENVSHIQDPTFFHFKSLIYCFQILSFRYFCIMSNYPFSLDQFLCFKLLELVLK